MILANKFQNLNEYLNEATSLYNGGLVISNEKTLVYIMPLMTFGKHVGDNYFEFVEDGDAYILSFVSKKGSKEYVKTSSQRIYDDLTFEEWEIFADEILKLHMGKQEYLKFVAGDFLKNLENQAVPNSKSGCMVLLSFFVLSIFSIIIFS